MNPAPLPLLRLDETAILKRLADGHTLITGNRRLARVLRERYHAWRIDLGDQRWPSPKLLAWEGWLDEAWDQASLDGVPGTERAVPGARQVVSAWEEVLRGSPLARDLLHPEALAAEVRDTRRMILDWGLDFTHPAWSGDDNENHVAFLGWNQAFERYCEAQAWLPPEQRIAVLTAAARQGAWRVQACLDLIGFDELTPAQLGLLGALSAAGTDVQSLAFEARAGQPRLWQAPDAEQELRLAARWVRHRLEADRRARIAIVCPDLPAARAGIERQLGAVLAPSAHPDERRAWNISASRPLVSHPMIEAAFDWLHLASETTDIARLSRVLRSPWLRGARSEASQRALLERRLRRKYPRELRVSEVRFRAGEGKARNTLPSGAGDDRQAPAPWACPELAAMLGQLAEEHSRGQPVRPPSTWAETLDNLLRAAGWPRPPDEGADAANDAARAERWQALIAWRECLAELASLDATISGWRWDEALRALQRICRERMFQPYCADAPVQVLGLYEASGLRFDHLWVLGLHSGNWPAAARPNAFIPGALQVEAGLPHASPQRELEVARRVTRRLAESAPDCVFSYPGQIDAEEVLPSPLLAGLDVIYAEDLPAWREPDWTERILEAPGPTLEEVAAPGAPLTAVSGGSTLLRHQALCPFRAFAAHRLRAEPLETPAVGISPALHGSLLHRVLEGFWRATGSHVGLLALDAAALRERLETQVHDVVEAEPSLRFRPALRAVETRRLIRHLHGYLALEKDREPFDVVGLETEVETLLAGQSIQLRIDRIDRLASGEEIIIDYKSGKVRAGQWFSERPEDPQLPLYAVSARTTPAAVACATIREDGSAFFGVSTRAGLLPGLPPRRTQHTEQLLAAGENMAETIGAWRSVLHRLMADFLAGAAAVDPVRERRTCQDTYCQFQALCRIDELDPAHAVMPEDEE